MTSIQLWKARQFALAMIEPQSQAHGEGASDANPVPAVPSPAPSGEIVYERFCTDWFMPDTYSPPPPDRPRNPATSERWNPTVRFPGCAGAPAVPTPRAQQRTPS
jgi:hypothetical protein